MNAPVTFPEYLAIIRQHFVEEASSPRRKHEMRSKVMDELDKKHRLRDNDPVHEIDDEDLYDMTPDA